MYRRSQLSIKCIFDYDIMEFATRIRYKRSFCYVSVTVDMCVCKAWKLVRVMPLLPTSEEDLLVRLSFDQSTS